MAALIGAGNKLVGSRLMAGSGKANRSSLLADRIAQSTQSGCCIVATSRQEDGVGMVDIGAVAVGPMSTLNNAESIVVVPEVPKTTSFVGHLPRRQRYRF